MGRSVCDLHRKLILYSPWMPERHPPTRGVLPTFNHGKGSPYVRVGISEGIRGRLRISDTTLQGYQGATRGLPSRAWDVPRDLGRFAGKLEAGVVPDVEEGEDVVSSDPVVAGHGCQTKAITGGLDQDPVDRTR